LRAAFVIFEGMTALDFVGAYDPLTRLRTMRLREDFAWDVCAFTEEVRDNTGLRFAPARIREPLDGYELLVVPGGYGTRELTEDAAFLDWLRTAAACELKTSVCTGSLLLGAAGFLQGRRATTHPSALEDLKKFCAVSAERVVDEGDVITAGGVTAAIDLGLHLCERLAGAEAREKIRTQMDYRRG
jgi:transcriptional regulator GlxA family with amidase domain